MLLDFHLLFRQITLAAVAKANRAPFFPLKSTEHITHDALHSFLCDNF